MKVIITGGTGMIGKALAGSLMESGYQVILFTRKKELHGRMEGALSYCYWNVPARQIDREAVLEADAIIHLAGAGVMDRPWSAKRKKEIVDSRVLSGKLLSDTLRSGPGRLKVLISAAAIGWYGADPEVPNPVPFTETQQAAGDFLGTCCREWEESTRSLIGAGIRVVYLRTGIVLGPGGGVLSALKRALNWRLAVIPGSGRQVISWIHLDDLVNLYQAAITQEAYKGPLNAVAPYPVSNDQLVQALAAARYGTAFITVHIPAIAMKWTLGERGAEALKSCTVSAQRLLAYGFEFRYPHIQAAAPALMTGSGF
ncbi:TIGR01777 family oxidoreductase [Niabella sp. CC-SYL272]|uniref:TIGR01777 family oxidoreductase n=1 Tax=Niabella agricola TaxID=2891571 RepID=UPI001F1FF93F|nr:TIGR01777 family oxidoreductase [Niabella agricola]MCF3111442.1 TIGR01777 family oxidoreductase [Niabella agricola]